MKGRIPQNLNKVPIKQVRPLVLKNAVTYGNENKTTGICIQDLTILLMCFKTTNFSHDACFEELKKFNTCVENYRKLSAGDFTKARSASSVNKLLKKYPNV